MDGLKIATLGLLFLSNILCIIKGLDESCVDFKGNEVSVGGRYQPYEDEPCTECICRINPPLNIANSDFHMCMTVQCARPTCDDFVQVVGQCCEYTCPSDSLFNETLLVNAPDSIVSNVLRGRPLPFTELVEPCCDIGKDWFLRSREQCGAFPTTVRGVAAEDQGRCIEFVHLCCVQERQKLECEKGKSVARIERSCEVLLSQQHKDDQRSCCSCCVLGIDASAAGVSCDLFAYRFPQHCADTFKDCCVKDAAARTQAPLVVTPAPSPPADGLCVRFPNQLCADICVDVRGSYVCECRAGFTLQGDGRTCRQEVIDRCLENDPCEHECVDTGTAINCLCFEGYILHSDGMTCTDIDECAEGSYVCRSQQTCVNTDGAYSCVGLSGNRRTTPVPTPPQQCDRGYVYNTRTTQCEDINECIISRFPCSEEEECINTPGGFRCETRQQGLDCGTGFRFDPNINLCQDINECALGTDTCESWQTCVNSVGSFACRRTMNCGTGYTLDDSTQSCIDIDECAQRTDNCRSTDECRNIPGSFRCMPMSCPNGYRLNDASGVCDPVVCGRGLKPDAAGICVDLNECAERNPCRPNQSCQNTMGGYNCRSLLQCGPGFELNEAGNRCIDVNECTRGTHDCTGPMMRCQNRQGTYLCVCPEGYQINNQLRRCDDVDECNSRFGGVCDINSQCENTQGSFRCICNAGFKSEDKYCMDVNECERDGMCMHSCRNTYGSFQCSCEHGYKLAADARSCEDVDECAEWADRGGSLCFGNCRNTMGSYICSCPDGYRMDADGRTCRDIDECSMGTVDCNGPDDQCINTRGGYKCEAVSCPKGFIRSIQGNTRSSAIRCQRQTFVCAQGDQDCLYAPLSLSYNFITFPTKIQIPADLFTMRGPQSHHRRLEFDLELVSAEDPITGESRVSRDIFRLDRVSDHEALVKLLEEIDGPQDIELKLNMNIHSREFRQDEEIFFGTAVAVIKIYVTQDFYE